ncbi:hypothetical protein HDA40_007134 [Hamadaea flava]|uniref:Uncharacterized protein n=1 Tax=Hamadaea flava TaxID=1742688 RepID=A0ABV8M3H3_9ACTN|nr:hypothetical protein [Hamadaea flava]MCP2328627.1 hypothetical protein [Hamadaea flava]
MSPHYPHSRPPRTSRTVVVAAVVVVGFLVLCTTGLVLASLSTS